ncbi:MAG: ACP S-malonyltransferase [Deltaproteobacteria bacterium]
MTGSTATTALVFPGQGCQRPAMARDFAEAFTEARLAFTEASDATGIDLARICFEQDPRLELTEFQQPAILTAEIAMLRSLQAHFGLSAAWFGGHSLGEYTALVAAGVIDLGRAAAVVKERGRLMQKAVAPGAGAMVAVLSGSGKALSEGPLRSCCNGLEVDVANLNSPEQIVVSGSTGDVDEAVRRMRDCSGLLRVRFRKLAVSAPFHCRLMAVVDQELRRVLEAESWASQRAATVVSNYTGTFHTTDVQDLIAALLGQASATVRWSDNMHELAAVADSIVEVGPGRPLRRFFASLGVKITSIRDVRSAEATFGRV